MTRKFWVLYCIFVDQMLATGSHLARNNITIELNGNKIVFIISRKNQFVNYSVAMATSDFWELWMNTGHCEHLSHASQCSQPNHIPCHRWHIPT